MLKPCSAVLLILLSIFLLNSTIAHSDEPLSKPTEAPSSTIQPAKSLTVLQRMAMQCKEDNNCPEYFTGAKSNEVNDDTTESNITQLPTPKKNEVKSEQKKQPSNNQIAVILERPIVTHQFNPTNLITPFMVKETASVGIKDYPVSVVFPLAYGQHQHTNNFYIMDSNDNIIPAQIEVLNRWWGRDQSIRHILVHFNASVSPFIVGKPNTGISQYALYQGKLNKQPANPITLIDQGETLVLSNNLITVSIQKKPLKIITPAGQLTSIFEQEDGSQDLSFNHENITITIEEDGPLRSIIKISSLTKYISPTKIKHGWALRLYTYADSSLLKVDFQLQNSAINTALSAPLYFKSHKLRLENKNIENTVAVRADNIPLTAIEDLPLGIISSKDVNVMLRNFWQTFPNGLASTAHKNIDVELWPAWSKQFYDDHFVDLDLYWLDDMKQTYKEILYDFSTNQVTSPINAIAATFQYPPVPVIPQEYYAKTPVTFDFSGVFPQTKINPKLKRIPSYSAKDYDIKTKGKYKFGMDNFSLDIYRKRATSTTGGWPYSTQQFFISGHPVQYYYAQNFAQAELNIRPQWLAGYTDKNNFNTLKPSTNPYAGNTWRRFLGHSAPTITRNYIKGSKQTANPRDDQHAWFNHMEHAYLMSGNKWIKDWYEFMAEFKKIYLSQRDPFPDRSHRAEGEALAVAVAAYKYTGNQSLKPYLQNYVEKVHNKNLRPPHNIRGSSHGLAAYQLGFLLRSFISIYDEFPANPEIIKTMRNYVEWNYTYGMYSYFKSIKNSKISTKTSETSLSLVDPVIWFAVHTHDDKYAQQAVTYVEQGLNGKKPYGKWSKWTGQYEAQMYRYYKENQLNK